MTFKHVVMAIPVLCIGGLALWGMLRSVATAEAANVDTRVTKLENDFATNRTNFSGEIQLLRTEVKEAREDVKGVYNFLLTRERQARFEEPELRAVPAVASPPTP